MISQIVMNFIIKYYCLDKSGRTICAGKMRVKNKDNKLAAQCNFEDFLKRKYDNFDKLVIKSCIVDDDIVEAFKDLFGTGDSNPFVNFTNFARK